MQPKLTLPLLAEILDAMAAAADWRDACVRCGADPGVTCVTLTDGRPRKNHDDRLSGDDTLAFACRAGATKARALAATNGSQVYTLPPPLLIPER